MIYQRMCRYQKPTAWILFFVFYLQLVSPVLANAANRTIPSVIYTVASEESNYTNFLPAPSSVNENRLAEIDKQEIVLEKVVQKELKNSYHKRTFGPGPTQPEMQSFQSVNSSNMVDLFSGDFSYNIPLLDVGGYPVNIHYSSGITMDQEASWVGLGWNINPGTINRTMRGLPDDFNGTDKITKTLSMQDNKTVGVTLGGNMELFGKSIKKGDTASKPGTLSASIGVFHNTYNGWGTELGINAGINAGSGAKGQFSGSIGLSNNSQSGLDVSPTFSYRLGKEDAKTKGDISIGTNFNSRIGLQALQMTMQVRQQVNDSKNQQRLPFTSTDAVNISFATPSFTPGITIPFTSRQATFTAKVGSVAWSLHPNFFVSGNYSNQYIDDKDQTTSMPAYGYLYYQQSNNQQDVLLDFNREKEVAFRRNTPNIAIPGYTYDIYSITGEGTGGMFRPYRGDIGMIYDHVMATKSNSQRFSVDLGFGHSFHGGVDLNAVWASTRNKPWTENNVMASYIGFKNCDSLYENVYFKNPGEKVTVDQSYFNAIGDDKLMRVELNQSYGMNAAVSTTRNFTLFKNAKPVQTLALAPNTYKTQRDKRTQVISYMTAFEAARKNIGLDTVIKSYAVNSFPSTRCNNNYQVIQRVDDSIRKSHHISEISVLNTDGRRYIYGLPVYNKIQRDVSFSVEKTDGDISTGLASYNKDIDNSPKNSKGKEHYFSSELIPAYSHSFLLTGILTPDYVDITGDGITEDDNGNAVKFNYTQVYSSSNPYKWRSPMDSSKAMYNEGLKTYSRDDRGSYSYGEREVWYLNSIESKTMIATFVLDDTLRKDGYGVADENGGRSLDQKLYRLKQINLYTKADFIKNGINAKPVKSVHFYYTYELCSGTPSSNGVGKLTLRKIWFSYNKNYKGDKNPYIFNYNTPGPNFNSQAADRWGNYKDAANNPGPTGAKLTNAEYPYSLQKSNFSWDSTKASTAAGSWALKEIKLPSGALMKVSYEADDYGYVQSKRAMQMFAIAGLGPDSISSLSPSLYQPNKSGNDYLYVYVRLKDAVQSKAELAERYFENVSKLYFKLLVKMPDSDKKRWGSGYEQIPCFADIEDYNIRSNSQGKLIWIRLSRLSSNSPLATAAIQFLRLNLPSKAYPYSEPGDEVGIGDVLGMLGSIAPNIVNSISGFGDAARGRNWCNEIDTSRSFLRLNNPDYLKFGGGHRVKKIEIFDNWTNMTTQAESVYGQTYDYTTTKLVNGNEISISSGVASYEPAIGKDENPFFQPIEYSEKMAALGATDYVFTEEPLGESFFPGAGIGYSRVTVQTVNKTKKSANGIDVTEFYTAKDFPTIVENTPLDDDSKKTYANPIGNMFKLNAQRHITLSQGFKIELNDMHGKVKSQSSYAQTDLQHPISYTENYYRVDNDNALNKHLSSSVTTVDSTNGVVNTNAQMGKDIDVLIDVREQTSKTISASLQLNMDFAAPFFFMPSKPNMPSYEVNRYRSIAVTKVVNRYAILDSVVHFDKGSKISTANAVYDGETGDVLVSRTQNEFDDPIYSFNYPAYWAYSGMGAAYKNIGGIFQNVKFLNGKISYKALTETAIRRYFESGDELIFYGRLRKGKGNRVCGEEDYYDASKYDTTITKIWAVELSKSGLGSSGIFFIDKDGIPITGSASMIKIIRSGRRNLQSKSVGSITSLQNPVKTVAGVTRLVFDSTTDVIAANVTRYKDLWKVDSSTYRKDTVLTRLQQLQPQFNFFYAQEAIRVWTWAKKKSHYDVLSNSKFFETYAMERGCSGSKYGEQFRTSMRFDFSSMPRNSLIADATLHLPSPETGTPQYHDRASTPFYPNTGGINYNNKSTIKVQKYWYNSFSVSADQYYNEENYGELSNTGAINVPATPYMTKTYKSIDSPATAMVDYMLSNFYAEKSPPAITIKLNSPGGCENPGYDRMVFGFAKGTCTNAYNTKSSGCIPYFSVWYVKPGVDGAKPVYLNSPNPGYYGMQYQDSFICKPNINDTATNPYRWGIWGNWQPEKVYAYYSLRKDSTVSASSITNIRRDGIINVFKPYWTFTTTTLQATEDVTRWTWTNQTDLINSKGMELQNHDALQRFNAAQYGYNQTLMVASAVNSRSREMVFDGFEDYGYTTDTCTSCPKNRFINFVKGGVIVDSVSHSGTYSLMIPSNGVDSVSVPVVANDNAVETIRAKSSTVFLTNDTTVKDNVGNGLTMVTRNSPSNDGTCNYYRVVGSGLYYEFNQPTLSGYCTNERFFTMTWRGYVQPKYSDKYLFYCSSPASTVIYLNGERITERTAAETGAYDPVKLQTKNPLWAGQVYPIEINVQIPYDRPGSIKLEWESSRQARQIIPQSQLTTYTYTPTNFIISNSKPCTNMDTLRQTNVILPGFSPIKSTALLVGAWVREKNNLPDTVSTYRNTQLQVVFNDGTTVTLKPSGNIIEGWQRIQDTLTVPANATQMKIRLVSTSSTIPVYFDDIRVHPYNANLKSYVYDPVNLRLVAELDENNYTSFYEYDDDGTLVRIKKETEKGIKTIKETRSALYK